MGLVHVSPLLRHAMWQNIQNSAVFFFAVRSEACTACFQLDRYQKNCAQVKEEISAIFFSREGGSSSSFWIPLQITENILPLLYQPIGGRDF